MQKMDLKIDPELRDLLPPLTDEERERLESAFSKQDFENKSDAIEWIYHQMVGREEATEHFLSLIRASLHEQLVAEGYEQSSDEKHVYFFQAGAKGPIKIGIARSVIARQQRIQPFCPYLLRLLGVIENGGRSLEAELHRHFRYANIHGEWFEPVEELLEYITENAGACEYA